jgi:tagatose-1,6-bisphosphate aldolase
MTFDMTFDKNSANGIQAISDATGAVCVLAIDHRDSMRQFLNPANPALVDPLTITQLKIDIVRSLITEATGVMLETEFSIPQILDAGLVPSNVGVIAALEAQGYLRDPSTAITKVLEDWSPSQARAAGASMVKLLLPYRPGSTFASAQEAVARRVLSDSQAAGIGLVLEPMLWGSPDPNEHASLVLESVRRFAPMQPAVLKLPFPGEVGTDSMRAKEACAEITEICDEFGVPWALLSGGGTFERFATQFQVARNAGCAGFMVGRALWGEAARAAPADRQQILTDLVSPRFVRLNKIVRG